MEFIYTLDYVTHNQPLYTAQNPALSEWNSKYTLFLVSMAVREFQTLKKGDQSTLHGSVTIAFKEAVLALRKSSRVVRISIKPIRRMHISADSCTKLQILQT